MNNFERAHNKWLEPPDDDPTCDGCGDTLERDMDGEWVCPNKFCPTKFSGLEKEMAEALVEFMDSSHTYKQRYEYAKMELQSLKEQIEELKWTIQEKQMKQFNAGSLYKNYLVLYGEEEIISIQVDDRDTQWDIYCNEIKVVKRNDETVTILFNEKEYTFPYLVTPDPMKNLGWAS